MLFFIYSFKRRLFIDLIVPFFDLYMLPFSLLLTFMFDLIQPSSFSLSFVSFYY